MTIKKMRQNIDPEFILNNFTKLKDLSNSQLVNPISLFNIYN